MTLFAKTMTVINNYRQQNDTLPSSQLRRLGLVYSSYRVVINVFFLILAYANANADNLLLPSLLQQTALIFYTLLSIILLGLFYVVRKRPQRQLSFGLAVDIIMLSLLLYSSGAPDLQLTMLYMVVVAASFMLLPGSQALVITLLAVIFVIYQQFFYALSSSISLANWLLVF
jgi:two-component system sensor histidine kinase PilS (NtrC family)